MIFREQQIRNYIKSGKKPPIHDENSGINKKEARSIQDAITKGGHFYSMLQCEDGHWAGDYGGPHFLMPGLVVAWYIMEKPKEMLSEHHQELLKH